MKLFVSYARLDKPYCIQIIHTLEVHEIWFDQRMHAGQHWWDEIRRRLEWCDGFVYLMSPESVASTYCQQEFDMARQRGCYIFPVLIHPDTELPAILNDLQYVDFSRGITAEAVKTLLNSIYSAETESIRQQTPQRRTISAETVKPPTVNAVSVVSAATNAMKNEQYDQAVFMLKRAKSTGFNSRFVNIDDVLAEAEAGLERQIYLREAGREYVQIVDLVHFDLTHNLGCRAFHAFREHFPDYDPDDLLALCGDAPLDATITSAPEPEPFVSDFELPWLEWCAVPEGVVELATKTEDGRANMVQRKVAAFQMSRYPVTNAQYQVFVDDPDGYTNPVWWQFSQAATTWHTENPEVHPVTFSGDERPRERINWYEAVAFCNWLSAKLNVHITLPTDLQWIRAARGDDQRKYPWGDNFDQDFCNTRESDIKMTTEVMDYDGGVSPFGVYDMAGNTWEWCLDATRPETDGDENSDGKRLVHGGSFISPYTRAEIMFRYYLVPQSFHSSIGFRIVATTDKG